MKGRNFVACALLALSVTAFAATPTTQAVRVENAWIRWLPANLPMAGYAVIVNDGGVAVRLVGVSSPVYQSISLMQSRLAHDDSTMLPVTGITIPAHGTAKLSPGGYHVMLGHATRSIKPGDKLPMTLHFAGGQSLQVEFSVLPANSTGPASSSSSD